MLDCRIEIAGLMHHVVEALAEYFVSCISQSESESRHRAFGDLASINRRKSTVLSVGEARQLRPRRSITGVPSFAAPSNAAVFPVESIGVFAPVAYEWCRWKRSCRPKPQSQKVKVGGDCGIHAVKAVAGRRLGYRGPELSRFQRAVPCVRRSAQGETNLWRTESASARWSRGNPTMGCS